MGNKLWDPQRKAFQQAIKAVREQSGMKQVELAPLLHKPQSYISKYENGERKLDYVEVVEILDACGWTVARFHRLYLSKAV